MKIFFSTLILAFLVGCPPNPPAPPGPPVPDVVYSWTEICANLATLGCSEGLADNCVEAGEKSAVLTNLKPSCLGAAVSVGDVMACGTVACTADLTTKPAATCANACSQVKRYGCPEAADCLATCTKVVAKKLTDLKLACLVAAKSKSALQTCGSIACK